MSARPAFTRAGPPFPSRRPDPGRPVMKSSATYFHNVGAELQRRHDFIIHPEFASEQICSGHDALQSMPIRECDIAAAVIQRDSQRRYVRNPFVY